MTISSRAQDVRARRPQGKIGQLAEASYLTETKTVINSDPQAAQVSTLVVDTATNSHEYTLEINGVAISYTADGSATKAEIAAGLVAAIDAEHLVRGQVGAADDGVDTVTLTGEYPGVAFVLSAVDALLTSATLTTAAEADDVPFGRLVVSGGYSDGEATALGILAASGALEAQVDTLTVDFAAGELYGVSIEIEGESYGVEVAADTDDATTSAAITTALNAMLPANTVVATNPAATSVVLTAEVAGKAFKVKRWLKSGTTARLSLAHTTATKETDLNRMALGVSLYTIDEENTTVEGDDVVYPANAGVQIVSDGLVWVENSESVDAGDDVYVELGVSADNGKLFNSSSATRVKLNGATWERAAYSSSGDDIAVVRLSL
jgi:hypothetical protein